jgi:hypothetical protein
MCIFFPLSHGPNNLHSAEAGEVQPTLLAHSASKLTDPSRSVIRVCNRDCSNGVSGIWRIRHSWTDRRGFPRLTPSATPDSSEGSTALAILGTARPRFNPFHRGQSWLLAFSASDFCGPEGATRSGLSPRTSVGR